MSAYRKPTAIVLTEIGVYYDDGRQHPTAARMDLNNLAHVLSGASQAFSRGEGVIMLDRSLSEVADSVKAPEFGWSFTAVRPWTTFTRKDGSVVHLGLLPELETVASRLGPLLAGHQGPADIAYRLGRYATLTGCMWRYTAGVTGCQMLRLAYTDPQPGRQPLWRHAGPKGMRGAGPMLWDGPGRPQAGHAGLVHAFDINAMYLAALKNARLGWGRLEGYSGPFDPQLSGWWEVDVRDLPAALYDGSRPPVFPKQRIHKGTAWLTTPVVKYLLDLGLNPQILVAHVSTTAETLARGVAERLIRARAELLDDAGKRVLPAVKRTYAEMIGMMGREGGSIYRPDWAATIQDLARMNMLRRLDRARAEGLVPFRIRTDSAEFLTEDPTVRTRLHELLGVGTGPGAYKYVGTLTVSDYLVREATRR